MATTLDPARRGGTPTRSARAGARSDALVELVAASARGDERAFQCLYRATSAALFGIALRTCKRRDWAEEVLQETFVSVWRHAARYDASKGAVMTWLIRIVRNQSLDWINPSWPDGFERRHGVPVDAAEVESAELGGLRDTFDLLSAERMQRCLAALDAPQRQSIALVFFHGMSHGDLAQHLRKPLGTVKAWVRRGIKSLRSCLGASG